MPQDAALERRAGRYGGEEFIIVFPETNLEEAGAVAERLRVAVADEPDQGRRQRAAVTVSIGLARRSRPGRIWKAVPARRLGAVHREAGRA